MYGTRLVAQTIPLQSLCKSFRPLHSYLKILYHGPLIFYVVYTNIIVSNLIMTFTLCIMSTIHHV